MPRIENHKMEEIHEASQANETTTELGNCSSRRTKISHRLRPILKVMKLAGEFYGDSCFLEIPQAGSNIFSRFYCASVLLGQCTIFVQAVTSIFFEGFTQMQNTYFLLTFSIWYLECMGINTICLFVLPKSQKKPSRLSKLVSNLFTKECNLSGLTKGRLSTLLAIACFAVAFNSICLVALDFYGGISVARFQPWNGFLAYRLLHLVFGVFNSFAWILPALLFCVVCTVLSGMFRNLQKKLSMQNSTSLNIEWLRQKQHKLCETVALADKVFSPYLFVVMSLHIPLICFNFYQLLKNSNGDNISYIINVLYWWMGLSGEVALILVFGIRVNEKIHNFYYTMYNLSVPDKKEHLEFAEAIIESRKRLVCLHGHLSRFKKKFWWKAGRTSDCRLLQFLMHLRGEPIGLSVGGLVVIDKSLALSIVGIIISYLAVLLTLPS